MPVPKARPFRFGGNNEGGERRISAFDFRLMPASSL
jgi:hypothetical protein